MAVTRATGSPLALAVAIVGLNIGKAAWFTAIIAK